MREHCSSLNLLVLFTVLVLGVGACGPAPTIVVNTPPSASAGPDEDGVVGSAVVLDGSGSNDADGDALTYAWTLTGRPLGSATSLVDAVTATPSFVPDVAGEYVATLEVDDGSAADSDSVTVTVTDDPPSISGIVDQSTTQGEAIEVPFTIDDELPENVDVTATSDDTTLVPASGLAVKGSGADRTLVVTPNPLGTGSVAVSLIATDGSGNAAAAGFALTVRLAFRTQLPKITANDAASLDGFGRSVAVDGIYALVSAWGDDDDGTTSGSVYALQRSGDAWVQVGKITASDAGEGDQFGVDVAMDGEYAVIGANRDDDRALDAGAAYVFRRTGNTWSEIDKLTASDGGENEAFAVEVAIGGDVVVIGASGNDANGNASGAAYVYERSGDAWPQTAKLLPDDGAADDLFGFAVDVDGSFAIVGAPGNDDAGSTSGSAYVFERRNGGWTQVAKLVAADAAGSDNFGISVALAGEVAIVGARGDEVNGVRSGSAYVFQRIGGSWTQIAKLVPSDGTEDDEFGSTVATDGDDAIIGAVADDDVAFEAGSAYIFRRTGDTWTQTAKLTADDGALGDGFGGAVALDGDYAFVGASGDDDVGSSSGSAYVYRR